LQADLFPFGKGGVHPANVSIVDLLFCLLCRAKLIRHFVAWWQLHGNVTRTVLAVPAPPRPFW